MEQTFVLIKPNAMQKQKVGAIIQKFESAGLKLIALKMISVPVEQCKEFYQEHRERPFFSELVDFITSAPVVVMAWEGEKAVSRVREIMGDTDPQKSAPGTLRREYGDSIGHNAVHGSDSVSSAERELALFFSSEERFKRGG